jgi:hypothetical protein
MKRHLAWVVAALLVLAAAGAGVGAWLVTRGHGSGLPQISAYSQGTTVRVDCAKSTAQEQLSVTEKYPVQVSVPTSISRGPWRLLRVYPDERDTTTTSYRPGTQLAVTVPTVDPQRGRIAGLVVQLMTLVQDENGELFDLPHAEWSLRLDWPDS